MLGAGLPAQRRHRRAVRALGLGSPACALLPMSDDPVETHVVIDDEEHPGDGGPRGRCTSRSTGSGCAPSRPPTPSSRSGSRTPSPVRGCSRRSPTADVVLLPPSNPVVSIGTILAVPGIEAALRESAAPVVGVSPIVGGAPVRGMADKVLAAIGVEASAAAVARHYGPDLLDGWLVDDRDAGCGVRRRGRRDPPAAPSRC